MGTYNLIYTNNRAIMEGFGKRYGYSLFHNETVSIERPLHPDTDLDRLPDPIPKSITLCDEAEKGFTIHPKEIIKRGNSVTFVTTNSIYVIEEKRAVIE